MCLPKCPQVCRFSEICHWTVTYVSYMGFQKFPFLSLQIFWNLPLDSYLGYLSWNLPLDSYAKLPSCACRNSPQFAVFLKSATGQLPKLPTCACRNSFLPEFADFLKSATGQLPRLPFLKYANGQLCKLPSCACRNSPSLQIFWNLPLDSYLGSFPEICHWTVT